MLQSLEHPYTRAQGHLGLTMKRKSLPA